MGWKRRKGKARLPLMRKQQNQSDARERERERRDAVADVISLRAGRRGGDFWEVCDSAVVLGVL